MYDGNVPSLKILMNVYCYQFFSLNQYFVSPIS